MEKKNIREVEELPEVAVEGELIYNKADDCYYFGVNTKEEKHGDNLEEDSV